ncbi:YwqG family protein [Paenibacillus sp. FSL R7-0297]|uniref:YwqG family protein n=1 Tax=Paenibacillus sp. FSL R7-0297 TaxID=2921680 RepID=UPI0030F7522B
MNTFKIIIAFILLLRFLITGDAAGSNDTSIYKHPLASDQITDPSIGEIRLMLGEAGLDKYWDTLKHHILPGFYMVPKMTDETEIKLGASKIGGHPDMPSSFQWPSWKNHPMSFVAQINLEEFPMNLVNPGYPATGILYFFYVYDYEVWYNSDDYDSDKKNNNVVYYSPETTELVRMEPPMTLSEDQIFRSALLEKKLELTIPDSDYLEANHLMNNETDLNRYSLEFRPKLLITYDRGIGFRFLGHMTALQYGGHPSDEILLFQADSDDQIGMEWDLSGLLHFFIKADDFKKLFFENIYTYRVGT